MEGNYKTTILLQVTALLVDDEGYWKRCCKARWQICDVSAYGRVWKRMYFERHLQRIIEQFVPETTDTTELTETLPLCRFVCNERADWLAATFYEVL